MSQSNFIAAFIFAAFVVYITLKGELSQYMKLIIPQTSASTTPAITSSALPDLSSPTIGK